MVQLVGQTCARCGERIPSEFEARFCGTCGSPVHDLCARPNQESDCPACGTTVTAQARRPYLTPDELQSLAARATLRFHRGDPVADIHADLVSRGMNPEAADQLLAANHQDRMQRGPRGLVLRVLGFLVLLAGAFLLLGNQLGFFPTVPFAGTITIFLGGWLFALGGGGGKEA